MNMRITIYHCRAAINWSREDRDWSEKMRKRSIYAVCTCVACFAHSLHYSVCRDGRDRENETRDFAFNRVLVNGTLTYSIMSKVNNFEWYALVKYKTGNTTEVLPVHKIKVKLGKGERIAFNPKSLTDFNKTEFYTVYTTHGSEDGKEHKWYALIGLLAGK